jgi:hypothetical protein
LVVSSLEVKAVNPFSIRIRGIVLWS